MRCMLTRREHYQTATDVAKTKAAGQRGQRRQRDNEDSDCLPP